MEFADTLSLWWVYPVSVLIATVALSTGISGALFFAPFFLLVVGLSPAQAIGAGLMTELFGTGFGAFNYLRQRCVDLKIVLLLLIVTIPVGMVGAGVALVMNAGALQVFFGGALIALALLLLWNTFRTVIGPSDTDGLNDDEQGITVIQTRDGQEYRYKVCQRKAVATLAAFGSFLTGLMGAGLPEINTTQFIIRCRIPTRVAVATSITILTVTVFFAAGIHALAGEPAWRVVVWSIPGVVTGAQIGPRIQGRVPTHIADRGLAGVFMAVGVLVIFVRTTA